MQTSSMRFKVKGNWIDTWARLFSWEAECPGLDSATLYHLRFRLIFPCNCTILIFVPFRMGGTVWSCKLGLELPVFFWAVALSHCGVSVPSLFCTASQSIKRMKSWRVISYISIKYLKCLDCFTGDMGKKENETWLYCFQEILRYRYLFSALMRSDSKNP